MPSVCFNEEKIIKSTNFDDVYYNIDNGLEEKKYVFIQGNNLPDRFNKKSIDFSILELGFGTGLSFLLTAIEFSAKNRDYQLNFISTELYPLTYDEITKALSVWNNLYSLDVTKQFLQQYKQADLTKDINIKIGNINLTILIGDATVTLKNLDEKIDCFYLDGFAPSKNPVMWGKDVFSCVKNLAKKEATCSTYACSRIVKDILVFAGFEYKKQKGFGKKREMIVGKKL